MLLHFKTNLLINCQQKKAARFLWWPLTLPVLKRRIYSFISLLNCSVGKKRPEQHRVPCASCHSTAGRSCPAAPDLLCADRSVGPASSSIVSCWLLYCCWYKYGFGPWTVKPGQFAVQPPLSILEDNFTVRLHLDNTTIQNGALKVVPGSHRKGIYRTGDMNWSSENEVTCEVPAGGMMLMKPLLLHSSSRSTNNQQRRVIHIEFSRQTLPAPLRWSEMIE